jgi:hypothetical protein
MPEDVPTQAKPAADATVGPNAAPAERQIVLSQQSVADALRELKLPETPQNVMIAQSLAQMDQPVSAQNMAIVRDALRGLAVANADDVAAAVVLLMHDLPVTPAGIAAIRQLMNGPSLPDQLSRLGGQLTRLLGQLDATGQQLATLGLPGGIPGTPPLPPPPGSVAGVPLNILPAAVQAAAANAQAAIADVGDSPAETLEALTSSDSDDAGETGESDGPSGAGKSGSAGAAGGTASLVGTGNRRENAPISRALGGAIGRMTSDQTEGVGQPMAGDPPMQAESAMPKAGSGEQTDQQQRPSTGGQSSPQGNPASDADLTEITLEQFAAKQADTSPKLNIGTGRQGMPDAPLPPGQGFGTTGNAQDQPPGRPDSGTGANTGANAGGSGRGTAAPQSSGTTASGNPGNTGAGAAATTGKPGNETLNVAQPRLNVGAMGDAARTEASTGKLSASVTAGMAADTGGVTGKLAPAMQLLRSAELATTVREPAYLPQQIAALKTVFRELPGALLSIEKELREFAADPRPVEDIPLPELEDLLAKTLGHRAGAELDAEDEGLLRHLFDDLRKAMVATSGSLHETLGNLHAREQLTQSTNVMCLPLALPGPPPRPVELLVEADPEDEQRRRQGGSPVHMRLSVDTHHLGRVGIDVVSWQEKLSIKLQVRNPAIQALVAEHLEQLDKALARGGFVTPDLAVAIAPVEQRASMLLPERKFMRSLRRIEGII